MINDNCSLMNENLTLEEFIKTKPDSVKELFATTMRILDVFANLTYSKPFSEIISEYSSLDRDTRQDKILLVLKRFSLWCQQDHPDVTYPMRNGKTTFHKKKASRTILTYTTTIRAILESVYGIEITVRNFKKKLSIPDPLEFDPEPFTVDEVRILCDYARPKTKLHYMTIKDSGMRIGESVAIRKKHIDTTKDPIEITLTAKITKTNRTRITYVTRETKPMLLNHLSRIDDEDLVFGSHQNQQHATDNAEKYFADLREKIAMDYPVFAERYEENGRHKKNLHSLRAFTATQCADAVDEAFGHGIIGHKRYLGEYIRNQNKMAEKYKRAEPSLMIYEKIEVIDHTESLEEMKAQLKEEFRRDREEFMRLLLQRDSLTASMKK